MITNENKEFEIENFTTNSNINQFQTTEIENSTKIFDTIQTIVCYSNEIPFIPNSIINQSELHITYNIGTTLFFICSTGYESLFNQTSFTTCSINGTWSIDTINITMCQLSTLESLL